MSGRTPDRMNCRAFDQGDRQRDPCRQRGVVGQANTRSMVRSIRPSVACATDARS